MDLGEGNLNILQLHRGPVHPPSTGEEVRIWRTARRLADFGSVELAHPTDGSETLAPGVHVVDLRNPFMARKATRIYTWYAMLAFGPDNPYDRFQTRITVKHLSDHISPPDIVCCESPQILRAGRTLARHYNAALLLNKHNAMYELVNQQLSALSVPGLLRRRAVTALQRQEQRGIDLADAVVFQSPDDRESFDVPADTYTTIIPNGTDVSQITEGGDPEAVRADLDLTPDATVCGFVGAYDYDPNRVAAEHIVEEIAPACPDIKFVLVGRAPPPAPPANVLTPGFVTDLPGILELMDVALCPLTMGSGTKLKMMDYLAAGLPIVTTPVGAQGIPVEDGESALIRPIEAFPTAIEQLTSSPDLAARLAANAAALGQRYDWETLLADYEDVLAAALVDQ